MASAGRNLFAALPPPAECLGLLIGTAELTIFGIAGLASPAGLATGFGIPLLAPHTIGSHPGAVEQSTEESEKDIEVRNSQKALISALAARNVQNGLLLLWFGGVMRDRKSLGVVVLTGLITTATDYLVVSRWGVKEAAGGHLFGVFNCLAIGGSLLWWNRGDPWY